MRTGDWRQPYPSRREPVCADAVVATSQPLAASAGLAMLERGGTAVDAALATAMALTVVEPTGCGLGGDAVALVADADGRLHGLNASGRAPAALDAERLRAGAAMPRLGWDAVTVPGAVSGWAALHARFARLDLSTLAAPGVRLARDGFPVGPVTAAAWRRGAARLAGFEDFARSFLPGGRAPAPGERVVLADHAATLERIADTGGAALYSGELAERLAAHAAAGGGALRVEDLASHEPEWVEPLAARAGPQTVHEPPPSTQGLAAVVALELVARTDVAERDPDDPQALHWQIEAVKQGLADARAHVADPAAMTARVADLLDPGRLDRLAAGLDPERAGDPGHGPSDEGGTVLVVAADAAGRAVSLLQSNYEGFGSGVVVPGTGIALHNRGAGFATDPRHPNAAQPGKRPFHTLIPAVAGAPGAGTRPAAAFGLMGGAMQAQGHVQLACRSAIAGQSPQAAIDAPRWRVGAGRAVTVEPELPAATREALARRGHRVRVDADRAPFGGAQAVAALGAGGWAGASDPRKEGHAAGR